MAKKAIIIGAGPAGLTAGLELLRRSNVKPVILEMSHEIGGISRTIKYKGNRMDIGGHRFFSKSDRVMQWWMDLMPTMGDGSEGGAATGTISYQGKTRELPVSPRAGGGAGMQMEEDMGGTAVLVEDEAPGAAAAIDPDLVMLIRPRKSRIYYLRKFFDYPIKLTGQTLTNLGAVRTMKVGVSYMTSRMHQIKPEKSLEDFLINRFGRELYLTFFKSYTEKVWGTPCHEISAEWGAQRIKGLSLTTAVKHFVKKAFAKKTVASEGDVSQKDTDTSLIERFMYPKLGPGQLWEHAASEIKRLGGEIHMGMKVVKIECVGKEVSAVEVVNDLGVRERFEGEYFFSTMPMRELVQAMETTVRRTFARLPKGCSIATSSRSVCWRIG